MMTRQEFDEAFSSADKNFYWVTWRTTMMDNKLFCVIQKQYEYHKVVGNILVKMTKEYFDTYDEAKAYADKIKKKDSETIIILRWGN